MVCATSSWRDAVDLSRIDVDTRRKIFEYVVYSKGVTHRELGIDRTYFYRLRTGKSQITDGVLRRLLEHLSEEEFRKLLGSRKLEAIGIVRNGIVDYGLVIEILNHAKQDPYLKSLLMRWAAENILPEMPHIVKVTEGHIKKFERLLATKAKKTREDRLRYLRKALEDLEYELTPEKLEEYILSLAEESINKAQHVAKTLKLFIKHVLKDPKLYYSFRIPRAQEKIVTEPITLEDVVKVVKAIRHLGAKTFFILLAETGLRPGEALSLSINDVDLRRRTIRVGKVTETKRSYITFLHRETAKFIEEAYLPFRRKFLERFAPAMRNLGIDVSRVEAKFFPFRDEEIRAEVYEAMDTALGKRFRLYDLRAFFATYMIKQGVSPLIVNILQGRVPPREFKVLQQHYLPFTEEDLRRIYEEKAPCITKFLTEYQASS